MQRASALLALPFAAAFSACGGAQPANLASAPASVAAGPIVAGEGNQQGDASSVVGEASSDALSPRATGTTASAPGGAPWTGRIVIWCRDPRGAGCLRVSALLGASPKADGNVPDDLLAVRDGDDCSEPVISAMRTHLSAGLGMSDAWAEQVGDSLDQSRVPRRYAAAGCLGSGSPSIKISASQTSSRYLVRVWESTSD